MNLLSNIFISSRRSWGQDTSDEIQKIVLDSWKVGDEGNGASMTRNKGNINVPRGFRGLYRDVRYVGEFMRSKEDHAIQIKEERRSTGPSHVSSLAETAV